MENQDSPEPAPALHPEELAESKMTYSYFLPTSSSKFLVSDPEIEGLRGTGCVEREGWFGMLEATAEG